MITIQEHLGCDNAAMAAKAQLQWERVSPKKANGEYKKLSLANRVTMALSMLDTAEYSRQFTNGTAANKQLRKKFLRELSKNDFSLLKELIG